MQKKQSEKTFNVRNLSDEELRELFEERKKALLEVRNEIDRRDREKIHNVVDVDFTKYVEDGNRD